MTGSVGKTTTRFFEFNNPEKPLSLRVGGRLARFTLAYEMYGRMNASKSNVILLFHAMTGSQHAAGLNRNVPGLNRRWTEELHEGWWDAFIGPGKALDTRKFCVICANYLGGCYGSTGPASINPQIGKPWGPSFPVLRMVDIVESQLRLLDSLGVKKLCAVTGASIGGYLSLLLATRHPDRVRIVVPIGTSLETTIVHRILNFEQITAIESDLNFKGGAYYDGPRPDVGLALARRIAHKTFVSPDTLHERARGVVVSHKPPHGWYEMNHPIESYMLHQGRSSCNALMPTPTCASWTPGNGSIWSPKLAPRISTTSSSAASSRNSSSSALIRMSPSTRRNNPSSCMRSNAPTCR